MIIVLKSGSTDAEVDDVCRRIRAMGYTPHTIRGELRTVIGAVGDDRGKERLRALESLECVEIGHAHPAAVQAGQPRGRSASQHRGDGRTAWRSAARRSWSWPGRARWSRASRSWRSPTRVKAAGAACCAAAPSSRAPRRTPSRGSRKRAEAPGRGAARDRAAGHHRGDGARQGRAWWPSTPTSSRSARATCRTSRCCGEVAETRQAGAAQARHVHHRSRSGCSPPSTSWPAATPTCPCERGIRTFETATRYTLDLNAVPVLKQLTHLPVVVDPSHGTGHWEYVDADGAGRRGRGRRRPDHRGAPAAGRGAVRRAAVAQARRSRR